jgi:hypothetical protein
VDLKEISWECNDWNGMAYNKDERQAVVNMVMKSRIP